MSIIMQSNALISQMTRSAFTPDIQASKGLKLGEVGLLNGGGQTDQAGSATFGEFLMQSIEDVNSKQVKAESSIGELLSGKSNGLHETMLSVEKADVSLRLIVKVRNKALESYKEIMRMQV